MTQLLVMKQVLPKPSLKEKTLTLSKREKSLPLETVLKNSLKISFLSSSIFSEESLQKKLILLLINHSTFLSNNTNFLKDQKDKEDVTIEETTEAIIEEAITEEEIIEDHQEEKIEETTEDKIEEAMIEESKKGSLDSLDNQEPKEMKIVETTKELTIEETPLPSKEDITMIDLLVVTMIVKVKDTLNNVVIIVQTITIDRIVTTETTEATIVLPVVNTTEISIVSVKMIGLVNNNKNTCPVNNLEINVPQPNGQKSNKSVQEKTDLTSLLK